MTTPLQLIFLRDTRHGGSADQPAAVAAALADFIAAADVSVDVAIYDFRLSDALAGGVVGALLDAAGRGVGVRVAYDEGKPADGTAVTFAALGGDPAPVGTAAWVRDHFAGTAVQTRGIAAGGQLMHDKFVLRDAQSPAAQVWTGSTNFTDDAWTVQEDNIVIAASADLAAGYRADFDALWESGGISGTGRGGRGRTRIGTADLTWDFAPGDGAALTEALVDLIASARTRVVVAAMVLTSHPVLAALAAAVDRGVSVSGIYDSGQMDPVVALWRTRPADATLLRQWGTVSALLADKRSEPYSPTSLHDFMHNKILVCDDTTATGSFNFSAKAQHNAENQVRIADPATAQQFVTYVDTIAAAYRRS